MNIDKLKNLPGWSFNSEKKCIEKTFVFKSYLKNIAFVNAIAWIANRENHHPDLEVSFDKCIVRLRTHDLNNEISEKDFNLAEMIEKI